MANTKDLFLDFDDDSVVVQNVCSIGKIIPSGDGWEYWIKLVNAGTYHYSDQDYDVVNKHREKLKSLITAYYLT